MKVKFIFKIYLHSDRKGKAGVMIQLNGYLKNTQMIN